MFGGELHHHTLERRTSTGIPVGAGRVSLSPHRWAGGVALPDLVAQSFELHDPARVLRFAAVDRSAGAGHRGEFSDLSALSSDHLDWSWVHAPLDAGTSVPDHIGGDVVGGDLGSSLSSDDADLQGVELPAEYQHGQREFDEAEESL